MLGGAPRATESGKTLCFCDAGAQGFALARQAASRIADVLVWSWDYRRAALSWSVVLVGIAFVIAACGGSDDATTPAANATPSTQVQLRARNLKFNTKTLVAAASVEISVRFENDDPGVLHNLAVYRDKSTRDKRFVGELTTGRRTVDYRFETPEAGDYYFRCDTHPDMNGAFLVR